MTRRGRILFVFALASCAQDGRVDPSEPADKREVVEREKPKHRPEGASCERESQLGQKRASLTIRMPGPISGLAPMSETLWACGHDTQGKGYLVRIERSGEGELVKTLERTLAAPCRGVTARGTGLAAWLDQGQAIWLGDLSDPTAAPLPTTFGEALDADRPLRSIWSSAHECFFVAAGRQGVLRIRLQGNTLVQDPSFESPSQHAQDLAMDGETLLIADTRLGVLAWSPREARLQARWPEFDSHAPVHRLLRSPKGRIFAASSASWIELGWNADRSELRSLAEQSTQEPVVGLAPSERGPLALTATRLWQGAALVHQRFPELDARPPLTALASASVGHFWLATKSAVELWSPPSNEPRARLVPLTSQGTLTSREPTLSQAEIPFRIEGEGALWIKAPSLVQGDGIILDPPHWPQPDPRCPDLYRVQAPARFSIRLRSAQGTQGPRQAQVQLESSDLELGHLSIPVDINARPLLARLNAPLPELSLLDLEQGLFRPVQAMGAWHWIELIASSSLASEEQQATLKQLAQLAREERRNNRSQLFVSVIVGGPLQGRPLFDERVPRLFLDERHSFHGALSRTPNGRFYPLRLLIDPQGNLVYFDQHIGVANAIARYRERERYRLPR